MGTAHVVDCYRDVGQVPARIMAVGGGTKNDVWLRATSDFSGLPQILCEKTLGASYGNAFLAAVAVGLAAPADIDRWNPAVRQIEAAGGPAHDRHYALFRRLYDQTKDIAHALG